MGIKKHIIILIISSLIQGLKYTLIKTNKSKKLLKNS
jgi:hypothetical protein